MATIFMPKRENRSAIVSVLFPPITINASIPSFSIPSKQRPEQCIS